MVIRVSDVIDVVSFPHYFLQATERLAEQLKTREWIVARITSITERIVNRDVRLSSFILSTIVLLFILSSKSICLLLSDLFGS
jgi:hypothetical protein